METSHHEYKFFGPSGALLPKEEMLEVSKRKSNLIIGIPKETMLMETRVSLAPEGVALIVQNGHRVIVETKAGENAYFPDNEYAEAGAEIVATANEVFEADIILKIAPLSDIELELVKPGQILISTVTMAVQREEYFRTLMRKKVTALSFEMIKDKMNTFPLLRSMSEIAGNTVILIAGEFLADKKYGKGRMFGGFSGITPTEIVILGAGTVGEFAARAAMGLGAWVKVFDNSIYKLRRLQNNLNSRVFTSIIQPKILLKSLKTADVAIGAIHSRLGRTPVFVTDDMVKQMKQGSVIIDVSIDQGGCFETSSLTNHAEPVFQKHGVTHYCVPNIASRVPHTASYAFSNFFAPVLINLGESGSILSLLKTDQGIRHGVYIFNGALTNQHIGEHYSLPYQDIELLLTAL
ncbi:MAG: alanine dehydrogenase [Bacteroidetes bacterium]|nr:alanine dehydrogenase [Bacteroidota bacterium]